VSVLVARLPPILAGLAGVLAGLAVGCARDPVPQASAPESAVGSTPGTASTLRFAAFTTVREAYEKRIIPLFVEEWRRRHGSRIQFEQSYGASGDLARSIAEGFEADVAAFSNEEDARRLVASGLLRPDWAWGVTGGIVSRSVVVLAVRPGNPEGVRDWSDLARPGLRIVMPDPSSSGGGRWGVTAIYGAVLREAGSHADAEALLGRILGRVVRWSPSARSSSEAFEQGLGDVALSSESEVMRSRMFGHEIDWVVPKSTLRMDNPAVLVDAHADRHGVREAAQAFLEFLVSEEAQRAFVLRGFRPALLSPTSEEIDPNHREEDLWGIEELGGWSEVQKLLFDPGAAYERAAAAARED
jgi:sulfate/thiosulfate transport system substrate-binding protein